MHWLKTMKNIISLKKVRVENSLYNDSFPFIVFFGVLGYFSDVWD
jgi:hypothetical protein